jgi:hypothetical protein
MMSQSEVLEHEIGAATEDTENRGNHDDHEVGHDESAWLPGPRNQEPSATDEFVEGDRLIGRTAGVLANSANQALQIKRLHVVQ